jgi:hypothetical protein
MPDAFAASPPATVLTDVADLVSAIAWPAVAVVLVVILRVPLRTLVERVGSSARSVSIGPGGVSVDFGAAVTPVAPPSSTVLDDLRSPAPQLMDSGADTMFEQLAREEPAPYLLVDLGEGREWLTSRLYLLASLLVSMRRTRALVFVEAHAGVRGHFVGIAPAQEVRWALARAQPWLEADFAHAYERATQGWRTQAPVPGADPDARLVLDHHGRLEESVARELVRWFLVEVQAPPPPGQALDWVNEIIDGMPLVEHGRWLAGAELERMLGPALDRFGYLAEAVPRPPSEAAEASIGMRGHDVIALLDARHRFRGEVIEREQALEALAAQSPRSPDTPSR